MEDDAILTPDRLEAELEALAEAYPALTLQSLGRSLLGRRIPLLLLGRGRRRILYVGTHHATEWLTSRLLLSFLRELCEAHAADARPYGLDLGFLLGHRTLVFVPMLNPDGVAIHLGIERDDPLAERRARMVDGGDFSHWQANARGVDLNHNYDAGFSEYKRLEPSLGILGGGPTRYAGDAPLSEPETAALAGFIRATSPALILTLHTQGEEIYYAGRGARAIAHRFGRLSRYEVKAPEGAAAYGGLTDWAGGVLGIPSITLECGRGENPLPPACAGRIYARLRRLFFESITM